MNLSDSLVSTGMISPINASSLGGNTVLPDSSFAASAGAAGNSITVAQPGALSNFWTDSIVNPLRNFVGLNPTGSVANALDKAGLTVNHSSSSSSSFWSDLFLRSVIVVLGFIFVAVSLTMFGSKAAAVIVNETKKSFK